MEKFNFRLSAAIFLLSLCSVTALAGNVTPTAAAKPTGAVEAKLTVYKVTRDANDKEVLSPADKVAPDDLLEYRVVYQNNGKSLLKQLTANLPIPVGTTFVTASAKPAGAMASLEGKNFATMPLKRMVKSPSGQLQEQLVSLTEYRALKWNLSDLPEKNKMEVTARVRVNKATASNAVPK